MKLLPILLLNSVVASVALSQTFPLPEKSVEAIFAGRNGALVVIDCTTGTASTFHPNSAATPRPPCSTFKIWNTLIGLENGLIVSPDEPFYQWDGKTRSIPAWNQDLTLKAAFQASCVPAFQALARKIGAEKMQVWLNKIGYGDRNISAGIDLFWLPNPGRTTVLISPDAQAELIANLVTGKLPFSASAKATLKEIMRFKKTDRGTLYGKTGSGTLVPESNGIGWYVGYVETLGKTYAFACMLNGPKAMGTDARAITETLLTENGYL